MLWGNGKQKRKALDNERRREIAGNVTAKLEQHKELKVCADNMVGLIVQDLKGIKDDAELRYAIGVAVGQIGRYISNQVYQRLREKEE
jgi:transcriptional regulator NrdR family protein